MCSFITFTNALRIELCPVNLQEFCLSLEMAHYSTWNKYIKSLRWPTRLYITRLLPFYLFLIPFPFSLCSQVGLSWLLQHGALSHLRAFACAIPPLSNSVIRRFKRVLFQRGFPWWHLYSHGTFSLYSTDHNVQQTITKIYNYNHTIYSHTIYFLLE